MINPTIVEKKDESYGQILRKNTVYILGKQNMKFRESSKGNNNNQQELISILRVHFGITAF